MSAINQILEKYEVDRYRGFLPPKDPLTELPDAYSEWENLIKNFSAYINAGVIRKKIEELKVIENPDLESKPQLERAMLLLSFFAHAYVHAPPNSEKKIPASVALPLIRVAEELKRKPVLSHSSVVLNNWRRIDPNGPIDLSNISTLCQFHGGLDESWFYLVTVEIEQVGAKAIPLMLDAMKCVEEEEFVEAAELTNQVNKVMSDLTSSLKKVYNYCDPHTFYLRVRPFLASFESIEYQGTGLALQSHHGGSAAQSSVLQFFDAAFGVEYQRKATYDYLRLMRQHMPYKHAAFLDHIEKASTIKTYISKNRELEEAYKKGIERLIEFRNEHLKIVALYVMKQAKKTNATAIGTGGTSPMAFLKNVRNQNDAMLKSESKYSI